MLPSVNDVDVDVDAEVSGDVPKARTVRRITPLRIVVICAVLVVTVGAVDRSSDSGARTKYTVKACAASSFQETCSLVDIPVMKTKQPVDVSSDDCDETVDQKGSVSWSDLTLPEGKVLLVEIETNVASQTSATGFFVRPTRITREWGRPQLSATSASFYLADTGQFSVEFAPPDLWREEAALSFDALMLFVNPELEIPANAIVISDDTTAIAVDLGPNEAYVFAADMNYDWGRDQVFKVHDNTQVYFESGAHVRARIVQTEKKVDNVLISGYGILDSHYDLEPDVVGISDDNTHQTIGIYGKNIR